MRASHAKKLSSVAGPAMNMVSASLSLAADCDSCLYSTINRFSAPADSLFADIVACPLRTHSATLFRLLRRLSMPTTRLYSSYQPALGTVPNADPSVNAMDSFKLVAAQQLADALDIPLQQAFDGLETGKKGSDMSVPIPKFRLKAKPQDLASRILQTARPSSYDTVYAHAWRSSNPTTTWQPSTCKASPSSTPSPQKPSPPSSSTKSTS
jgi:hypothetical protein